MVLAELNGTFTKPGAKKPPKVSLFNSLAMVVMLMRRNVTQPVAGAIFGCSQSTVSRRWDLLRPVIGRVLASFVPDPAEVLGRGGTALVDGTVCPTWDWNAIPDLYSGKAKYTGMNVQIAASLAGDVAAIGPVPVHGARHDAYAFEASGLKELLEKSGNPDETAADLGYIGVDGIGTVPFRKPKGEELKDWQREFNAGLSRIRSAVEHAVAKVKTWRMLSEEGGRYRCQGCGQSISAVQEGS
jgi:DDE superfamily endonuclease/Helix-turn-helix of DDE superfamily endonuclease